MRPENAKPLEKPFTGSLSRPPRFHRQWDLAGDSSVFLDQLSRQYGDFVEYRGVLSFYLINHPSLVRQVLKETHRNFDKQTVIYKRFQVALGNGLVTAEGSHWKRQRKLLTPMFSSSSIRNYFELMMHSALAMAERWEALYRSKNVVFDLAAQMNEVSLEIAGRSLFSDGFDTASSDILRWTRVINRYSAKLPIPIISDLRFPSPTNLRLRATLSEYGQFLSGMIAQRRSGETKGDLLDTLLAAKNDDTGEPMSDVEIAEEAIAMIVGGHESTSAALTWFWYELNRHPEVEAQLRKELQSVTGGGPLKFEHFPQLVYMNMVIQETMRLHPPFWFENRNVKKEVELGGVKVPKGSLIFFSRYSLQRHPHFWKDPDLFCPERFRPGSEENPSSSGAHVPFGSGPRVCIGKHFAMMEIVVVISTILQRFKVRTDSSDTHAVSAHLTMEPKHGLNVRLENLSEARESVG